MSRPVSEEVARKNTGKRREPRSPWESIAWMARGIVVEATELRWPSTRYQNDPVLFVREILGSEPWDKQIEILEAVRDHKRVAVRSGHKIGKSRTAAYLALWFHCSYPDSRVIMTSATARQVDEILWREFRLMHMRSTFPIGGEIHELARSGLRAKDLRQVVGFTAKDPEAMAGISAPFMLYILDEASGIDDKIFEAIEGNRAGGAWLVMFSNPTQTSGEFYNAFTQKSRFYRCITVSSEDTPNCKEGRIVIPGLATREWVKEKEEEWGRESGMFKVRVLGQFAEHETGKIFGTHTIMAALARWAETPGEGRLCIGLDPAGSGGGGDESAFAPRRGFKAYPLRRKRGLTPEDHLREIQTIIGDFAVEGDDLPVVLVDREGLIGATVYGTLRQFAETSGAFEVVGVRASDRAMRQIDTYDRVRDELFGSLAEWLRNGGAIPADSKLERELMIPAWEQQVTGRIKATPKDEIKKAIDRSPDSMDALALSVWRPNILLALDTDRALECEQPDPFASQHETVLDPYAAARTWRPR